MNLRPLSLLVEGYPAEAPETGVELKSTDHEALVAHLHTAGVPEESIRIVTDLRKHLIEAVRSSDDPPVASAESAREMLASHYLWSMHGKWVAFALRADRTRLTTIGGEGGKKLVTVVTKRVPKPSQLSQDAPLPEGGSYLIIYGGNPTILGVADKRGNKVSDEVRTLWKEAPISDILFSRLKKDEPPVLYSLGVGAGDQAGQLVEFPDLDLVESIKR